MGTSSTRSRNSNRKISEPNYPDSRLDLLPKMSSPRFGRLARMNSAEFPNQVMSLFVIVFLSVFLSSCLSVFLSFCLSLFKELSERFIKIKRCFRLFPRIEHPQLIYFQVVYGLSVSDPLEASELFLQPRKISRKNSRPIVRPIYRKDAFYSGR
jgi:hypothetical protein